MLEGAEELVGVAHVEAGAVVRNAEEPAVRRLFDAEADAGGVLRSQRRQDQGNQGHGGKRDCSNLEWGLTPSWPAIQIDINQS